MLPLPTPVPCRGCSLHSTNRPPSCHSLATAPAWTHATLTNVMVRLGTTRMRSIRNRNCRATPKLKPSLATLKLALPNRQLHRSGQALQRTLSAYICSRWGLCRCSLDLRKLTFAAELRPPKTKSNESLWSLVLPARNTSHSPENY